MYTWHREEEAEMAAHTTASIMRGQRVEDEFLDVVDTWRRISTDNSLELVNQSVTGDDGIRNSTSTRVAGRMRHDVDVVSGDRVLDERTNEVYLVNTVTRTRLARRQVLLDMTLIDD